MPSIIDRDSKRKTDQKFDELQALYNNMLAAAPSLDQIFDWAHGTASIKDKSNLQNYFGALKIVGDLVINRIGATQSSIDINMMSEMEMEQRVLDLADEIRAENARCAALANVIDIEQRRSAQ